MYRSSTAPARDAVTPAPDAAPEATPESAPPAPEQPSTATGAPPMIGKRTLYVDRQVARRARSRSKAKKIRDLQLLSGGLVLMLIVASMGWILAWTKLQMTESELLSLDSEFRGVERDLERVRGQLEQREAELTALIENRLPGLHPLELDKLIDIEDKYVRNITFAQSGVEDSRALEYHVMVRNDTSGVILPRVKLYLFDEFGLQVGLATLRKQDATTEVALAELRPGETRSYHSQIEIARGSHPKYYLLHVE